MDDKRRISDSRLDKLNKITVRDFGDEKKGISAKERNDKLNEEYQANYNDHLKVKINPAYDNVAVLGMLKYHLEINSIKEDKYKQISNERAYKCNTVDYIYKKLHSCIQKNSTIWESIIKRICDDMTKYQFDKVSSTRNSKTFGKEVEIYKKVNLLEHTANQVRTLEGKFNEKKLKSLIIDRNKNYKRAYDTYLLMFCGVLHDFGKSEGILHLVEEDDSETYSHAKISASYIIKILINEVLSSNTANMEMAPFEVHETKEELKQIAKAVHDHHTDLNTDTLSLTRCLQLLDHETRQYELLNAQEKGQ